MHETTFRYLQDHPDVFPAKKQVIISQERSFGFDGIDLRINNCLKPTINEFPIGSWVFPKTPFIIYQRQDEELCRYCRIGYEARGLILGEIVGVDADFFSITPMKRSRVFDPDKLNITTHPVRTFNSRGYLI